MVDNIWKGETESSAEIRYQDGIVYIQCLFNEQGGIKLKRKKTDDYTTGNEEKTGPGEKRRQITAFTKQRVK